MELLPAPLAPKRATICPWATFRGDTLDRQDYVVVRDFDIFQLNHGHTPWDINVY